MRDHEEHTPGDDDLDEIEITDLPGRAASSRQIAILMQFFRARPALRARLWWFSTAVCLALLLAQVVFANVPNWRVDIAQLFVHPTPSPSSMSYLAVATDIAIPPDAAKLFRGKKGLYWRVTTAPIVPLDGVLGPAPTFCQQSSITKNYNAPTFPGLGGGPLWITGFDGPRAVLNQLPRATPPQYGWFQQVLLIIPTDFTGRLTLTGGAMGNIAPLWFSRFPFKERVMLIAVNSLDHTPPGDTFTDHRWNITPVDLYITRADCYYLQAIWPGGSWVVFFAAGK